MIHPSTRLRRALRLRSLSLTKRVVLSNLQYPNLIRNPDPADRNNTSLHIAAQLGLVDIADFLLARGHEEPGISRNLDGLTPLMLAAQAGNNEDDEITRARIQVGRMIISQFPEDAGIRDREGMDAFSHACRHGTLPIVNALLSLPVPSDASVASGYFAAQAQQPQQHGVTTPPPQAPAPPTTTLNPRLTVRDNAGNTPLHQASAAGQLKTVRLLVSLGADHAARNTANWTPLDYSASVSAEVYLRSLVREREGSRVMGNIAAAAAERGGGGGGGDGLSAAERARHERGRVRLVQSEDEGSDAGGGDGGGRADGAGGAEVVRGRARTAT